MKLKTNMGGNDPRGTQASHPPTKSLTGETPVETAGTAAPLKSGVN